MVWRWFRVGGFNRASLSGRVYLFNRILLCSWVGQRLTRENKGSCTSVQDSQTNQNGTYTIKIGAMSELIHLWPEYLIESFANGVESRFYGDADYQAASALHAAGYDPSDYPITFATNDVIFD